MQRVRVLLLWFTLLCGLPLQAAMVTGVLSNFDVHNFTNEDANDFHMIIRGVTCTDVINTMSPPGWLFNCTELPDGSVVVSWRHPTDYIPHCTMAHFGVEFPGQPDFFILAAYWTKDGRVLFPWLSFVNQRWEGSAECWVGDLVDGYAPGIGLDGVIIDRDFILMPEPLPLPDLMWDDLAGLMWDPGPPPEVLPLDPGLAVPLPIPVIPEETGAILVRYPVTDASTGALAARFTNELVLNPDFYLPPTRMFSNFDVFNNSGICVNDFHLSLRGITCLEVTDFYLPAGWVATCFPHPDGLGCDLIWTCIDGSCVDPGSMVHFGYGINGPNLVNFSIRAAYWTYNGVPIPPAISFVNQTWNWQDPWMSEDLVWGGTPLTDPFGVEVRRDWGTLVDPLPLPDLTWGNLEELIPWQPADLEPLTLPPDPSYTVPYYFEPEITGQAGALFIRYEVIDSTGDVQLRFSNEALIEPVRIPPIEDLTITYMGMPTPELAQFRLEWTPPPLPLPQPIRFTIYEGPEPYEPIDTPIGWTVDSFFDVFVEVDMAVEPANRRTFYRVTADYIEPSRRD